MSVEMLEYLNFNVLHRIWQPPRLKMAPLLGWSLAHTTAFFLRLSWPWF